MNKLRKKINMSPYKTVSDIPENVIKALPKHGEEIYQKAFNAAWVQYKDSKSRDKDRSREETAHAVAWSAVKKVFEKNDKGEWVKKTN